MNEELEKYNKSYLATAKKISGICNELLGATHKLVTRRPVGNTNFLRVLEATYRRAYHTFAAVHNLSNEKTYMFGGPAYILTRSLIEDGVSIEYMLAHDKEALAIKFQNFAYIQEHEDNKFIVQQGLSNKPIIKESMKEIEENYRKYKQDYKRSDGTISKNWAGIDVDGMLRELLKIKPPLFGTKDNKSIAMSYLGGNRKTHFNPIDLAHYLDQTMLKYSYTDSMVSALALSSSVYIRLSTRYIDEISKNATKNMYQDITKIVLSKLDEMNKLKLYQIHPENIIGQI